MEMRADESDFGKNQEDSFLELLATKIFMSSKNFRSIPQKRVQAIQSYDVLLEQQGNFSLQRLMGWKMEKREETKRDRIRRLKS